MSEHRLIGFSAAEVARIQRLYGFTDREIEGLKAAVIAADGETTLAELARNVATFVAATKTDARP